MVITPTNILSFAEYLNYDESEFRYELVNGKLELIEIPPVEHFLIVDFLETRLDQEIKKLNLPWLSFRGIGVRTGKKKSRLADLCVVTREHAKELKNAPAVFQSPPLLIIEVVSPESIKRDYRFKRSEYAALAVPEYWIVDPIAEKISILLLEEGLFEEQIFTGNQQIVSRTFPEINITPEQVFTAANI
jgi:Uma2 family endonuclease